MSDEKFVPTWGRMKRHINQRRSPPGTTGRGSQKVLHVRLPTSKSERKMMLSRRKNSNLDEKAEVVGEEKKQKNRVDYLKRMLAISKQKLGKSNSKPSEKSAEPVSLPNPIVAAEEQAEEASKDCKVVSEQDDSKTAIVVVAETGATSDGVGKDCEVVPPELLDGKATIIDITEAGEKSETANNDIEVVVPEQYVDAATVGVADRVQAVGTDFSSPEDHQNDISIVSIPTIGVEKVDVVSDNETPIVAEAAHAAPMEEEQEVASTTVPTAGVAESVKGGRINRVRFSDDGVQQPLRPYHPQNFRDRYYFGAKSVHRQQVHGLLARSLERKRNAMLRHSGAVVLPETVARPMPQEESQKMHLTNFGSNTLFEGEDDDHTYDDYTDEDTYYDDMATVEILDKSEKERTSRIFCGIGDTAYEITCGRRQNCHPENAGGRMSVSDEVYRSESGAPDPTESKNDDGVAGEPKPDPPSCTPVRALRAVPKRSRLPARARADPAPSFAEATPIPREAPSSTTPAPTKTTRRKDDSPPSLPRVVPAACGVIATATQCGAMEPQEEEEGMTLFNPLEDTSLLKDGDETYDDDTMTKDPAESLISNSHKREEEDVDADTLLTDTDWFEKKVDQYSGVLSAIDTVTVEIAEVPDTIADEICSKYVNCGTDPETEKKEKKAYDEALSDLMLVC